MPSVSLLVFGAVLLFLTKSQGCSPVEGWHTITYPQRLVQADIVAHVKVLNKTETPVDIDEEYILLLTRREGGALAPDEVNIQTAALPATRDNLDMVARTCGLPDFTLPLGGANNQTGYEDMWPQTYAGLLEVYCVLKGGPLQNNITVVELGELTSCSRTLVDIDEEYILLLTRREGGALAPDEVNIESAALPATQDNLDMVARTCGLPDFTLPLGGANNQTGCPTHPNDSGEQCVYAGAASHVVMSTALSLMCALLTCAFCLLWAAM
uniref:Uncharacterized protein n=1 Tax=Branchiostoma floridae TaxID=7739 RepID=C3ZHL5_BRAFL|eukprot:XP_002591999.1 hypothetical protein BRAFLDRAFT_79588 [Branchiostoma floridae]